VPASKTYLASVMALALMSSAIEPDPAFTSALEHVPEALRGALAAEREVARLAAVLAQAGAAGAAAEVQA